MSQNDPHFTDGLTGIVDPIVECLNLAGDGTTYQRYEYLTDGLDYDAIRKVFTDADGSHLGSDTRQGALMGPIAIQKTLASHKLPRPGHIVRLYRGSDVFYLICGKPGSAAERNNPMKAALDTIAAINPIITTALTEAEGQRYYLTQAAGSFSGVLASALSTVNTRSGSTLAYAIAAAPTAAGLLPTGLSCNASTGAITGTSVAGTYEFDIIVTETLANKPTRKGFARVYLVIT